MALFIDILVFLALTALLILTYFVVNAVDNRASAQAASASHPPAAQPDVKRAESGADAASSETPHTAAA